MALDAYSPCPCGSGKKFKWCCQPIHAQIDKALQQEEEGQHDAALRIMEELVAQHPNNPEAWGRRAFLLYANNRPEDAEVSLQKAFEVNPKYPFGYYLQGLFRENEGEIPGALLLFRKAADYYDVEARDILGQVYVHIAEAELKLNRPVAARAALRIAMHYLPGEPSLRTNLDNIFGDQAPLPRSARREYAFQSLPANSDVARRGAWEQALAGASSGKLSEAAAAFARITQEDSQNAPAWYNLTLTQAWLGDNRAGLVSLDRYLALEPDEKRASDAAALGEVLRCGAGMEEQANYLSQVYLFQLHDGNAVVRLLQDWDGQRRLAGVQSVPDQGVVRGLILEKKAQLTPELAATQLAEIAAYFLIVPGYLRMWNTNADAVAKVRDEVQQILGPVGGPPRSERRTADFAEITTEAVALPSNQMPEDEARERVKEHMARFYETTWIHRPLRSLGMASPIDAVGSPSLRKKVRGAVQFLEEVSARGDADGYDFDGLCHKLGLTQGGQPTAAPASSAPQDFSAMSAAELASVAPEALELSALEKAYQAAHQLDAREIAARFAQNIVSRPPDAARPDRYTWYSHLIQTALANGDTQGALDQLNDAEKADCEHNEGRRRNDYELRRGQIHAKRGEASEARSIFERLVERVPSELRFRGSAAEALLAAKDPAGALHFAEAGLAKARQQNDRDSEGYFNELVSAARRQQGS